MSDFLSKIVGAPSSGVAEAQGQVNPAGAADTVYSLHGYIPASSLNEQGAGFTAAARMLPGQAYSQGLQQIGKLQAAQRAQDATYGDELAKISATAPKLRNDLVKQAFDQAYKTETLQERKTNDAFNRQYKAQSFALSTDRYNLAVTQAQWRQSNADRIYGLSYNKFVAAEKKAALIAKNGGLTASQNNLLAGKVQDFTKGVYQGVPGHVTYPNATNGLTAPRVDSWKQKPLKYQQAIRSLVQRYPSLGAAGAIDAANQLYQPGEGGRPKDVSSLSSVAGIQGPGLGSSAPIVQAAASFVGVPYVWGGNSPTRGVDCSGFIQQAYKKLGVTLPRTTYDQVKVGVPVDGTNPGQLQPGDAIFTIPGTKGPEHVGMYIGGGMVQVSPHTGDVNKIVPLKTYLALGYVAARRYIGGS